MKPTFGKAGIFLLLLALSSTAQAQGFYLRSGPYPMTFEPLVGANLSTTTAASAEPLSFPFEFRFFGATYSGASVSQFGYLVFQGSGTSSANKGIPHLDSSSLVPQVYIAPWWDNIRTTTGTQILWQVVGSAPNRRFVVEWRDVVTYGSTDKFSFQVQLFEQTHQIRFVYGSKLPVNAVSASIGIQGGSGKGTAGMPCTNTYSGQCSLMQFPTDQAIDFLVPPDVEAVRVAADAMAYSGVPFRFSFTLRNLGGTEAIAVVSNLYLSTDTHWDDTDVALAETLPIDLGAQSEQTLSGTGQIPNNILPGKYFLFALADTVDVIDELDETNNIAGPIVLWVGSPRPDLTVGTLTAPDQVSAGETLSVTRQIKNRGNASVSTPFPYTYLLSDNEAITRSDRPVGTSQTIASILAFANNTRTDAITLPSDLRPGEYWLGLCVDFVSSSLLSDQILEISEVNNCSAIGKKLIIRSTTLSVATQSLSPAFQYAPYGAQLVAFGGNGTYIWTQTAGLLPPGLQFTPQGELTGTPLVTGTYSLAVKVSSDGQEANSVVTLQVTSSSLPLALADQTLPTAEVGQSYHARLYAVGGVPPYTWKVSEESVLPVGLAVASDGHIEGVPQGAVETKLSVHVTDAHGASDSRWVPLRVVPRSSIHILSGKMNAPTLGKNFLYVLKAQGGLAPYQWKLLRFQPLSEGVDPSSVEQLSDVGLQMETNDSGHALLSGIPTRVGQFALTLQVSDAEGAVDAQTFRVNVREEEALAITTLALPDAFIDQPYQVKILTNVAAEPNPNLIFSLSSGQLPEGLTLNSDGSVTGKAKSKFGQTLPEVHSFLVKVSDAHQRVEERALSIKVRSNSDLGGCHTASGLLSGSIWVIGLPLLGRKRKKRLEGLHPAQL